MNIALDLIYVTFNIFHGLLIASVTYRWNFLEDYANINVKEYHNETKKSEENSLSLFKINP